MRTIGGNKRKLTPFGVWVKTQMLQEDLKQYELAKILGIPSQNITRIIYGEVKDSKHNTTIVNILACNDEEKIKALEMI